MIALMFWQVSLSEVHAPLRKQCQFCPTHKIARENVRNALKVQGQEVKG